MTAQVGKRKFPLVEAYSFAKVRGGQLSVEVLSARGKRKQISMHEPNQASSVVRGRMIELFQKYGVLELFVRDKWPRLLHESTDPELDRCKRLLERFRREFGRLIQCVFFTRQFLTEI